MSDDPDNVVTARVSNCGRGSHLDGILPRLAGGKRLRLRVPREHLSPASQPCEKICDHMMPRKLSGMALVF
jgi:hypothetical protein